MNDLNTPPTSEKPLTIARIVQQAAMRLDGIGLDEKLVQATVAICEKQVDQIAAAALHSVLLEHINQLSPKPTRKSRKVASDDKLPRDGAPGQ